MWSGLSDDGIRNAMRIVKSHCFDATPITGGVAIDLPWTQIDGPNKGATGVHVVECHSIHEVFVALGY